MTAHALLDIDDRLDEMTIAHLGETRIVSPEPEPLMPSRGEQAPFPTGYLSPTLRGAVEAIARRSFVPPSLAAQSVLAACSLAVQPHFNVVLPTRQERPTSLFLVSVAESGDRKSTSDDIALTAIRQFEQSLEDEYAGQRAEAALQQSAWDEAKKEITQRVKKQGREALTEAYRDLGPRPVGPVEPTIAVRTGTTQGFLKRFATCRPSLGLMSDEGGSWLGGFGMSEDNRLNTIATLSDFWDGKTVQTLTSGEGFTALRGRRLTFHMMVQPIVADRLLGDAEALGQGFLSRMLVSHPHSLAGTRFVDPDAEFDHAAQAAIQAYTDRLARIVRAQLPIDPETGALAPTPLDMDDRARRLWWEFYNDLEARLSPNGDLFAVKGFVGKLPEMAARLAANIAVFEHGTQTDEIDFDALACGIGIAKFYLSEAVRLFGHQAPPTIYIDAQKLSDWLKDTWKESLINVTSVSKGGPPILRNRSDYIRDVIAVLVRHNHLQEVADGGMISGKKVRAAWRVLVR